MTRRFFLGTAAGVRLGFGRETERLIFVSMAGGPSQSDLFDFQAGSWTPDWMDPVRGFPRGLMPRLADRMEQIRVVRDLRAASLDHRIALRAHPRCDVSLRASSSNFAEACNAALGCGEGSVRIDFASWDHHGNLFEHLRPMCAAFDRGMAALMDGLRREQRAAAIVAMGEFGRTPGTLNQNRGRDHYPVHAALTWNLP